MKYLGLLLCIGIAGCASSPYTSTSGTGVQEHYAGSFSTQTGLQQSLLNHYTQWQGVPYRLGGMDKRGIDCSGFVALTYASVAGVSLPRTTERQASYGSPVARDALRVGDLVFFRTGIKVRHVGVYIGDARFMHASTSQGVTISRLDNRYWSDSYWKAVRPITR